MNSLYLGSTFRVVVFDRNGCRVEANNYTSAHAMYKYIDALEQNHPHGKYDIEVHWVDKHGTVKQVDY